MKKILTLCSLSLPLAVMAQFTSFVNPFIGTGGHGHTYPGASMPFGMVQLSPDTRLEGWDGCSGYHYSDNVIYGFSHTHLSGTGIPDYCDVLLMPTVGEMQFNNMTGNDPKTGYASAFSHDKEKASPGYYSVLLEDDNIPVELTVTNRVGMHKYSFPASDEANVILDLRHRDKLLDGTYIRVVSDTKVEGLRRSSSWAEDQWLYFALEFSQPFSESVIDDDKEKRVIANTGAVYGTSLYAGFRFKSNGKEPLLVKVSVSAVSAEGAWKNMQAEVSGWDFNAMRKAADDAWNKELSKIEISTKDKDEKTIFYTALYHCMLAPNLYMDADRRYRGMDGQIHTAGGFDYYTVFSLWDTFRALHPLLTIIDQKRTNDFINTFIKQYEQSGYLPVWELAGNETNCMIGVHSISVIADAAVKGILGYDTEKAYMAMQQATKTNEYGWRQYRDIGMIESNNAAESVSRTLEYAYDDWCISQMGQVLSHDDYFTFYRRSMNWINLFDGTFIRPRTNGYWYEPFDPFEVNFNYTEANAWQYNFFAPHDLGLLLPQNDQRSLDASRKRLDDLFTAPSVTSGREQADITGLIGQYAHGNEPSHNFAYLFNFVQQPEKTQYYVDRIKREFYTNAPDGLVGNEDCGQMSAWYVLSSLGFYPVCPGDPVYSIGSPSFPEATIHLENGKSFHITADKAGGDNIYVQSATINGQQQMLPNISHRAIIEGSTLGMVMSNNASTGFSGDTSTARKRLMPQPPLIHVDSPVFTDSVVVTITQFDTTDNLVYQTHGDVPLIKPINYTGPLVFHNDVMVKAISKTRTGDAGYVSTAILKKIPENFHITYQTAYDNQYTAGGDLALIDGQRGGKDFRMGKWQGWQGRDMQVLIDLGEERSISEVGAGFLQDIRAWIWLPTTLEVFVSTDAVQFSQGAMTRHTVTSTDYDSQTTENLKVSFETPLTGRYVMITARNAGTIPSWHPGAGGQSWIFCDEIWVK